MFRKTGHNTFCLLAGCFLVVCLFVIVSLANAESVSMLDIGTIANAKMKSLAAGVEQQYTAETSDIKAIRMADSLPVLSRLKPILFQFLSVSIRFIFFSIIKKMPAFCIFIQKAARL